MNKQTINYPEMCANCKELYEIQHSQPAVADFQIVCRHDDNLLNMQFGRTFSDCGCWDPAGGPFHVHPDCKKHIGCN